MAGQVLPGILWHQGFGGAETQRSEGGVANPSSPATPAWARLERALFLPRFAAPARVVPLGPIVPRVMNLDRFDVAA